MLMSSFVLGLSKRELVTRQEIIKQDGVRLGNFASVFHLFSHDSWRVILFRGLFIHSIDRQLSIDSVFFLHFLTFFYLHCAPWTRRCGLCASTHSECASTHSDKLHSTITFVRWADAVIISSLQLDFVS
jgi:hypothetical protein